MRYETPAERRIRIGQTVAAVAVVLIVAATLLAAWWGLQLPDPSTVHGG